MASPRDTGGVAMTIAAMTIAASKIAALKIAAAQIDIVWEDRKANFSKVDALAKRAADLGADLLVLPEMFSTGFSMDTSMTAESRDGATPTFIRELALRYHIGVLGGFVLENEEGRALNSALVVDRKGNDIALYTKTYLFSYTGEDRCHQAGEGPVFFEFEGCPATCFICYDLRFPELFRKTFANAEVAFVIASWPASRARHWEILLNARAIENQFYVVGVNRTGKGAGLLFSGGSRIVGPQGDIEGVLGDEESLLVGDILPDNVRKTRDAFPFLKDYRNL
jgi:predicted amidohydrolase